MNHLHATTLQSKVAKLIVSGRTVQMLFWIFTLALVLIPRAQAQEPVGYVIEIEGNWVLEGRPLKQWQGVPPGGVISISSPAKSDRITIAAGNKLIASRICGRPDSCNQPISLPPPEESPSSILKWISNKLFGDEGRYKSQSIRGKEGNLLEAVALLKDERLDLRATFQNMPKGTYSIVIRTLPREGKRKKLGPIPVEWDPETPAPVAVPPVLTPGLYQFELPNGPDELKGEVWALVSTPEEYSKVAASFEEVKEMTKKWGEQVEPETVGSFLRAGLEYLATRGAK
jgi:hypothetical protein